MNLPSFRYIVTVFHQERNEDNSREAPKWSKKVYKGCYFGSVTTKQVNGTNLSMADSYVCRIPKSSDNGISLIVMPGDIIVKGEIADVITDIAGQRPADLLNKHRGTAFTAQTVSDNDTFNFPHIRISGV
jgi:hypothetical protein